MSRASFSAALISTLAMAGCSSETLEPLEIAGPPASLTVVQGQGQAGGTGETLPIDLGVRVLDADGRPVPSLPISWTASRGSLTVINDSTDAEGIARMRWTLPSTVGTDQVTATADGVGAVTFTATVQPIPGTVVFRFLDAGGYHACGITTTEQLLCWGYGADGQLGLGATAPQRFPTLIPGDFRYRQVTGGYYHSCAFTLAANAWCWGNNSDGRLGDGSYPGQSEVPVTVLTDVDTLIVGGEIVIVPGEHLTVQVLQAGRLHSCAIDLAQHVWCWGGNPEGGLGVGEFDPSEFQPIAVLVLTDEPFKSVAVGGLHTCGVTVGGGGRCWGYNVAGQLGDGSTASSGTPVAVSTGPIRTDPVVIFHSPDPDFPLPPGPFIAAGYDHTCAILVTGATVCWGLNQNGQIGDNSRTVRTTPATVAGGHAFAAVTAGLRHTCALDTDGAAWCWGANNLGQIGDGTLSERTVPTAVSGGFRFAYIKAGELFTCGVTSEGAAYCWGDNEYGQLGDGTTTSSRVPVKVAFQP